jgi:dTDP-4-dehydrorhamnose reductase
VNQLRAVELAMQAIRTINPDAILVQTEDLGKTYARPTLQYQAEFENERRWLTYDILSGQFDEHHLMWHFLHSAGIPQEELVQLCDEACAPDIIGINHYLTSERFLDDRMCRYPLKTHGGNGQHQYADVEAVRVVAEGVAGPHELLQEAWDRYHQPLAVTEVHLGAGREQQLRWLYEVWTAAHDLRAVGVDVRAVTTWSLFGAYDWHNLITRREDYYEPGAFDVRSARGPRPTALASMVRDLAHENGHLHPVLAGQGWWRRTCRFLYETVSMRATDRGAVHPSGTFSALPITDRTHVPRATPIARPLLITGTTGTLGNAFTRICAERDLACCITARRHLELSDPRAVARSLDTIRPWAVVNAAGYTRVDDAEHDQETCYRDNVTGPYVLAEACARRDIALLTFSSNLVFDGKAQRPYVESDIPQPLSVYGRCQADAEQQVLTLFPAALVVRTSTFFSPWDECHIAAAMLRTLDAGMPYTVPSDEIISPTYVPDLVHTALDLLIDGVHGIWHLTNHGHICWSDFATTIAERTGRDTTLIHAQPGATLGRAAQRPRYSVLGSEHGLLLPSLDSAITRYSAARPVCT